MNERKQKQKKLCTYNIWKMEINLMSRPLNSFWVWFSGR